MASAVNVHQARTRPSRLREAVRRGEEEVIARNGASAARLMPYPPARRTPVAARGRGRRGAAFFEDLSESALRGFEGGP